MVCLMTVSKDWLNRAIPGPWYEHYHEDWHKAYPGAWVRGELVQGGFYSGNVWGSSTLAWDEAWFRRHRAKMPKGAHYVRAGFDTVPLTEKLSSTDTGIMRLQFRKGELR